MCTKLLHPPEVDLSPVALQESPRTWAQTGIPGTSNLMNWAATGLSTSPDTILLPRNNSRATEWDLSCIGVKGKRNSIHYPEKCLWVARCGQRSEVVRWIIWRRVCACTVHSGKGARLLSALLEERFAQLSQVGSHVAKLLTVLACPRSNHI